MGISIDVKEVASVYSGKEGCMCGCLGDYKYASEHRDWASKNRGYPVRAEEVNDKSVKLLVGKVVKLSQTTDVEVSPTCAYVKVPDRDRVYCIYFKQ